MKSLVCNRVVELPAVCVALMHSLLFWLHYAARAAEIFRSVLQFSHLSDHV